MDSPVPLFPFFSCFTFALPLLLRRSSWAGSHPVTQSERIHTKRRAFFKTAALSGLAAPLTVRESAGYVGAHNWGKYDFGLGPPVKDRLYQGPFPQYAPELLFPGGDVVMATTPSDEVVPGFGK